MRASALRPNPISCIMWNTILDEKGRGGWEEKPRTDQEALCGDGVCCESSVDSDDRSNLEFVMRKGAPLRRSCRASDNFRIPHGVKNLQSQTPNPT